VIAAPSVAAVICAAGSSTRMGGIKKEYCPLGNSGGSLTVLGAAAGAFASVPLIRTIVIAVPENGEPAARQSLPHGLLAAEEPKILFVSGGRTRRASVFNALSLLTVHNPRYVLIHDGARPWVSPSLIERIIQAVIKYDAVIPLLPLIDTPKEYSGPLGSPAFITRHLTRANTGIAQTPQAFAFPEILRAHEKAAEQERERTGEYTDDAEVWGKFCGPVAVIPGEDENRKITFPGDLT
jgi:2-C-methyl-D-erythritol 4-phosphate cytidylyltransferase